MRSVCVRGHQAFARNLTLRCNSKRKGRATRHDDAAKFQTVNDGGPMVGRFGPDWSGEEPIEPVSDFGLACGFDDGRVLFWSNLFKQVNPAVEWVGEIMFVTIWFLHDSAEALRA